MDKKIHLNVYYDPWINAVYCDEHENILSLRDCLVQATDIKSLYIKDAQYALDQTVPYTLLTMLLARVFHPDHDEKLDMFDEGTFDIDKIDEYIKNCEKQGISFNVFDDNRPFLQDPDYKKWKKKAEASTAKKKNKTSTVKKKDETSTVGILDPLMVSGNNTVFYHNKDYNTGGKEAVEKTLYMTPPQFIASVTRNHMYHNWSGGSCSTGYTPTQPPLHCIIHGKNLFETLIISIPPNAHGIPLWERRYDMTIPEIESIGNETLDYLSAALLPTTSIHYGEVEDGVVKNIYYTGNIYKDKKRETSKPGEFTSKFFVKGDTGINLFLVKDEDKISQITLSKTLDISMDAIQIIKNFDATGDKEFLDQLKMNGYSRNALNYVVYGGMLSAKNDEPQSTIMEIQIPVTLIKANGTHLKIIASYAEKITTELGNKLLLLEQSIQNKNDETKNKEKSKSSLKASGAVWTIVRHFSEYASDQLTQLHKGTWLYKLTNAPTEETMNEIIEEINEKVMDSYYSYRTKYIVQSSIYASKLFHDLRKGADKNNDRT